MTEKKNGESHIRFNFAAGLLHGVFYRAGMAFSEPMSVLPVFLNHFTGSLTMIGVFSALMQGGGVLPQLFVANRLEGRQRKKSVLVAAIWVRAAAWGILGLLTYFWSGGDATTVLVALVVLLFIFSFAGGVASVPFADIWGKALPATLRGRFFGHRQLWGGLMAMGSAYVVKRVLGNPSLSFPNNYGLLFLLSFVFLVVSYISLSSVREPDGEEVASHRTLAAFLRQSLRMVWDDRNMGRLLVSQVAIGFGSFSLPFYVLYGKIPGRCPGNGGNCIECAVGRTERPRRKPERHQAHRSNGSAGSIADSGFGIRYRSDNVNRCVCPDRLCQQRGGNRIHQLPPRDRPGSTATCVCGCGRHGGQHLLHTADCRWTRGGSVGLSDRILDNHHRGGGGPVVFTDVGVRQGTCGPEAVDTGVVPNSSQINLSCMVPALTQ